MPLNEKQEQLCSNSQWDFSDLKALFLNCTLKRSPEKSHTQGLIDISNAIMEKNGISVDVVRPVDYFGDLAIGVIFVRSSECHEFPVAGWSFGLNHAGIENVGITVVIGLLPLIYESEMVTNSIADSRLS